jgi:hypothetical protein
MPRRVVIAGRWARLQDSEPSLFTCEPCQKHDYISRLPRYAAFVGV